MPGGDRTGSTLPRYWEYGTGTWYPGTRSTRTGRRELTREHSAVVRSVGTRFVPGTVRTCTVSVRTGRSTGTGTGSRYVGLGPDGYKLQVLATSNIGTYRHRYTGIVPVACCVSHRPQQVRNSTKMRIRKPPSMTKKHKSVRSARQRRSTGLLHAYLPKVGSK